MYCHMQHIHSSHIHTYIHTYTHTHIHTYTHTYIHTYTHTYIHTHIHTYIHTYNTYIHTCTHAYNTYITDIPGLTWVSELFNITNGGRCLGRGGGRNIVQNCPFLELIVDANHHKACQSGGPLCCFGALPLGAPFGGLEPHRTLGESLHKSSKTIKNHQKSSNIIKKHQQ